MSQPGARPGGSVLGIDAGTVRVGVAGSDETGTIASPLTVLRRNDPRFWHDLDDLLRRRAARLAVVGLPRRADGSEGEAAIMARSFATELTARTGCPVELWDERFTSEQAERTLLAHGLRRARRRERVDSVAAALLLQSWLDDQRRQPLR